MVSSPQIYQRLQCITMLAKRSDWYLRFILVTGMSATSALASLVEIASRKHNTDP